MGMGNFLRKLLEVRITLPNTYRVTYAALAVDYEILGILSVLL
jgi:hypothetical protein